MRREKKEDLQLLKIRTQLPHPIVDDPIHNLEQIIKIIVGIDEKIA
jgi:hypothetical protein